MKKAIAIIISIMMIIAITLPAAAISTIAVKSIKLNNSKITLKIGQSSDLKVTFTPANTSQKMLSYVTANKNIATIDATGKITGVSSGTTTITVYTLNKTISAKCIVTIAKNDVPKKFEGQTIRYIAANHMWNDTIKPLIPQFEKETGIKVSLESYEESQLTQKLSIEFASGNSNVDAFMTRPLQEGKMFTKANWYAPLDDFIKVAPVDWVWKDFMAANVKATTENGKVMSIPLVNECETLFYRKDLFEAAKIKPPTTLDEMEAAAKALNDPAKEVYGIVSRGNMGAAVTQFSSYLYGFGGDFIKDGKCVIDSPEAVKAIQFYGRLLKNYGPPGVINMSWPQAVALFSSGKAAMYTDASVMLAQMTDPAKSKIAGKIGVVMFPAGPAGQKPYMVTSWALAISQKSSHKEAAWEFIRWSTSKANMTKGQLNGVSQTRNSVWGDPKVTAKLIPNYEAVSKKSAEIGMPYDRPVMTQVGEARDAIGSVIVKSIVSGGTDDIATLSKEAAKKVNDMLVQAGEGGK